MEKLNCWEFKGCGREPGGTYAWELGPCPATAETRLDGVNGGLKGGRSCWIVSGTLCDGRVQGTYAAKATSCVSCEFYRTVRDEEKAALARPKDLIQLLW